MPGARDVLERLGRRPRLRVPSRPEGHLGGREARDLRRRALHDRAGPRSEGQRRQLELGVRGPGRRSRRPTRRRCASVSRSPTPSGSSPSSCRSSRRPPTRARSPATSIAVPSAAGRTGSRRGIRTAAIRLTRTARRSGGRVQLRRGRLPRHPGRQHAVPGRSARRARRVQDQPRSAEGDRGACRTSWRRYRVLKVPQPIEAVLIWNVKHPFLSDARVRRALAHAWPREETARQPLPARRRHAGVGSVSPGRGRERARRRAAQATIPPRARGCSTRPAGRPAPDGVRRKGGRKAQIDALFRAQARVDDQSRRDSPERLREGRRRAGAAPARHGASSRSAARTGSSTRT